MLSSVIGAKILNVIF